MRSLTLILKKDDASLSRLLDELEKGIQPCSLASSLGARSLMQALVIVP